MNVASLADGALQNEPDSHFYYNLGKSYASTGDYASASRALERAFALNPLSVDALVNLADCYGRLKAYDKRVGVLNKIVALCPTNAQALGDLAATYELLGNKNKAEECRGKIRKVTGQ